MNHQSLRSQHIRCLHITNPKFLLVWAVGLVLLGAALSWAAPAIVAKPVISGLLNPIAITNADDNSGRLFIALQIGQIIIYDGTQRLSTPFLDISSLVSSGSERGLLSVAFHPKHASNGFFFVTYTNIAGDTVIARYTVSVNPNVADPSSALILLTINQPFSNHNGGQLQFGPDGFLYIGMGDGGSGGDPQNNAQNLNTLLGKMLRIDVDGGIPYDIPPDNPFLGTPGARDEIWSLGLRNPWRFSFDRLTGDLFLADVGQESWEEVDFQSAGSPGGENYGWRLMEGNHCFNPSSGCNSGGLTLPIIEYNHSVGCSITGGYRYRGAENRALEGFYFYGDFCTGCIWGAIEDGSSGWTTSELLKTNLSISSFGEDENGEIYFAHYSDSDGAIFQIVEENKNLLYTPVTPCRIVDTRKTAAGMIGAFAQRNFQVFGSVGTINAQGGNPAGCPSMGGAPYATHINMIAVTPTGKGNLQAFPLGATPGAGLSVNYNTIDTNIANAGIVKAITGSGPDITVASNFSSAHTVIDVLGYYYSGGDLLYAPVTPCRIVDTRNTTAGIIGASTQRNFRAFGSGGTISAQGGSPAGCSAPMGEPLAAHINLIAVDPTGKGNLQAFPVGVGTGAGLSVNYNTIDTNLANAGSVKTVTGSGPDITVASNFSSAHTVIDVLGYYYPDDGFLYTPVSPCRIVDTRKTSAGIIDASVQRDFRVFGPSEGISVQGGNPTGCPWPLGEPLAAHLNMVAVSPTGKGNLQAFPAGAGTGAGLSVSYNTIDTNLANAGTVKTVTGTGADISVASNFSSAHTVIDVLGYYYPAP